MGKITVNAVGKQCPVPVVEATRALRAMTECGTLEVLVDNRCSLENVTRFAANQGYKVVSSQEGEDFRLVLTK